MVSQMDDVYTVGVKNQDLFIYQCNFITICLVLKHISFPIWWHFLQASQLCKYSRFCILLSVNKKIVRICDSKALINDVYKEGKFPFESKGGEIKGGQQPQSD